MLPRTHESEGTIGWDVAYETMDVDVEMAAREKPSSCETTPERRLLLAVLLDAIVRLQQLAHTTSVARRSELHEAERWVRSDSRRWPFSFVNVCEALGLAHEPLRRALLRPGGPEFSHEVARRRAARGAATAGHAAAAQSR